MISWAWDLPIIGAYFLYEKQTTSDAVTFKKSYASGGANAILAISGDKLLPDSMTLSMVFMITYWGRISFSKSFAGG